MTNKEIRKRRWLRSLGRKKIYHFYLNKIKHHYHETILPLNSYSWKQRFWSLLTN